MKGHEILNFFRPWSVSSLTWTANGGQQKIWSLMVKSAWRSLVLGRMGSHYDGIFWGYRFCMPHKYQQNYWNIHACHHHSSRRVQPLQLSPRFESHHLYLQEQRSNWNESFFFVFLRVLNHPICIFKSRGRIGMRVCLFFLGDLNHPICIFKSGGRSGISSVVQDVVYSPMFNPSSASCDLFSIFKSMLSMVLEYYAPSALEQRSQHPRCHEKDENLKLLKHQMKKWIRFEVILCHVPQLKK